MSRIFILDAASIQFPNVKQNCTKILFLFLSPIVCVFFFLNVLVQKTIEIAWSQCRLAIVSLIQHMQVPL